MTPGILNSLNFNSGFYQFLNKFRKFQKITIPVDNAIDLSTQLCLQRLYKVVNKLKQVADNVDKLKACFSLGEILLAERHFPKKLCCQKI